MKLTLALFALNSALRSVHGQEATSLRGNVVMEAPPPAVAGGVNRFRLMRAEEQVNPRIIGGSEAIEDRFSYAVSLLYSNQHWCGGSLIARDVVLTAAHCGPGVPIVAIGRHNVNDGDGEEIAVREEVSHPDYNFTDNEYPDNDVMLLFLEGASANNNVITVKLNSNPLVPSVGQDVTVMGWGDTNIDLIIFEHSEILMNVNVSIISNEECEPVMGLFSKNSKHIMVPSRKT
jgi:secreted trypsin-like serine protease